jgi:hypothetical protein
MTAAPFGLMRTTSKLGFWMGEDVGAAGCAVARDGEPVDGEEGDGEEGDAEPVDGEAIGAAGMGARSRSATPTAAPMITSPASTSSMGRKADALEGGMSGSMVRGTVLAFA